MENTMKNQKTKQNPEKRLNSQQMTLHTNPENRQELYLQHLMEMTVGLLDRGFHKN